MTTLKEKIDLLAIQDTFTLLDAMKRMDEIMHKLVIVVDNGGNYKGLLSIGDIQRAILKEIPLTEKVINVLRKEAWVADKDLSIDIIKSQMIDTRTEFIPVIDSDSKILNIWLWDDFFEKIHNVSDILKEVPIVIMAGGRGTRLSPITNIIPKPLVPIGDKPIIELIINRFSSYGSTDFHLTVNYKALMIKQYFDEVQNTGVKIDFVMEDIPLGTAGSLKLLENKIHNTFFVSNCDILIEDDYGAIYTYHKSNENDLTVVAAIKSYSIPYGIMNIGENGNLESLEEKPEYSYFINAGMYVLEPELLEIIPERKFFHITDLIELIKRNGGKVGVYPVSGGSWMDIGNWKEYQNTLEKYDIKINL